MFFFLASLSLFMACSLKGWYGTLIDFHGFRQTQTALSVSYLLQGGDWLKYETPVLGPPWSIPFEFPLYQWLVAITAKAGIFELDQSGRFVSILFFLLALFAVYKILESLSFEANERFIVLSLICLSPLYIFWSRSFMIESTALALSAWYLWLVISFFERRDVSFQKAALWFAGVAVLGSLAGAVKVTTFCTFWAGAFVYICIVLYRKFRDSSYRENVSLRGDLVFIALALAIPLASIFAWTSYADSVKALNPIGVQITSKALTDFNFGTLSQKISLSTWKLFYDRTLKDLMGNGLLLILGVGLVFRCRADRRMIAMTSFLLFLLPLCIFTNLYFVHNYYAYANGVFLIVAIGIVIADLWYSGILLNKVLASAYFIVIVVLSQVHYFKEFLPVQGSPHKFADIKPDIDRYTAKDDVVIVMGADWSSEMPYYLQRRAYMYQAWSKSRSVYEAMRANLSAYTVGAALFCGKDREESFHKATILTDYMPNPFLVQYRDCDAYYAISREAPPATADVALPVPIQTSDTVRRETGSPGEPVSFSNSLPGVISGKPVLPGGKANLESLNGKPVSAANKVGKREGLQLKGWALDTKSRSVPGTVVIELASVAGKGNYYAPGRRTDKKRPDVARLFKDDVYEKPVMTIKADVRQVPPGVYVVKVIQHVGHIALVMDTGKHIEFY